MRTNISEHYLQVVQTWASLVAQLAKNPLAMQETPVRSWVGKIPWRRDRLPTPVFMGFPGGSDGKESACNVGDLGLILGWEDPLEKKKTTHSSILENSMDCMSLRVAKSWTRLSDFHSPRRVSHQGLHWRHCSEKCIWN